MKNLKDILYEASVLADIEDTLASGEDDIKKMLVKDFINDIYVCKAANRKYL